MQYVTAISPGDFLLENFIVPLKKSPAAFADSIGIKRSALRYFLKGGAVPFSFIYSLSEASRTPPILWVNLQANWQFVQFVRKRKEHFVAAAIANPWQLKFQNPDNIINGLRDLLTIIKQNDQYDRPNGKMIEHPGVLFYEKYIKPSRIASTDWRQLLCVKEKIFNNILRGKREMPIAMILKLSKLLGHSPKYWIELQINHYAILAEPGWELRLKKIDRIRKESFEERENYTPIRHLLDNFLNLRNLTISDFGKWINIKSSKLPHFVRGDIPIDFELAMRIGEALKMDPMYWVRRQSEHDMIKFESKLLKLNSQSGQRENRTRSLITIN